MTVVMAIALVVNGVVLLMLLAGPRWSPVRSIAQGDAEGAIADPLLGRLDALEQRVERLRLGQFHDAFDRVVEGAANDQERCIRIARHIAANMGNHFVDDRIGASTSDVLSWWESRKGLCNARANVMIKALRRYNIEARLWNIYDYDFGHSAVQAYYDGAWHYFDPTYAGCFLDEEGTVMSWEQVVADPEAAVQGMVVFESPWDKDGNGVRVGSEERMRLVYAPEQLAQVKAAGERWSGSFRLPVQLRVPTEGEDAVWFGRVDGDASDLRSTTPLGLEVLEATRCKYLDALGMYHENFMHELTLDGVDVGARYRLTWHFLPERHGPATLVARSSTGRIVEGADGPVCSEAAEWSFIYEPGAGDEHRIEVGLSDDENRSYVRVDALRVETIPKGVNETASAGRTAGERSRLEQLVDQLRNEHDPMPRTLTNLNAWIVCSIGLEDALSEPKDAEGVLEVMGGSCGWRDVLFEEAAEQMGLRHRRVGFLNVPTILSHAATEIEVDGEWRFFDATYGCYFTSPSNPDPPLSIAEVRSRWPDVLYATVMAAPNQGRWLTEREFKYDFKSADELPEKTLTRIERLYILSDLVIHDMGETYDDRLAIPLASSRWRRIGEIDESYRDMLEKRIGAAEFDDRLYSPFLPFLGPYWSAGPIINKVLEFQTGRNDTVEVRLHFVGEAPAIAADVQHVAMRYDQADRDVTVERQGSTVTIQLKVFPPTSRLVLRRLDKGITLLDAIEWFPLSSGTSQTAGVHVQ